jgi:DHA1 family bicyclomycin/chloramphenicol resistance-like MFS transporter
VTTLEDATTEKAPAYRIGRNELLALISAIMALTAMAIDLMLPAFGDIRESFGLAEDSNRTGQIITVFFFGLAIAHLFYGPLADRFGRKPVLYVGMIIYVLGAAGSALAPSFELLLVSRFVWGVGAAGSRVVATAIVRDRFEGVEMAKAMSQIMAVFVLVPVFAPGLGSLILLVLPWPALFWFCGVFALLVALWSIRLRETLAVADRREITFAATKGGYAEVARTPVTFGYTMASLFIQGVFTSYLATVDLVVSEIFDRESQFPIIFGVVAIGFGLGALGNGRLVGRFGIDAVVTRAFRVQAVLLVLLVLVTVFSGGKPEFWLYMPLVGLVLSSFMFLMPNLNSAAMEPVGHLAGSGSALTGAVRIAGGAIIGGILASTVHGSLTPLVLGMAAMCALAAACVWLVRTGRRLSLTPTV